MLKGPSDQWTRYGDRSKERSIRACLLFDPERLQLSMQRGALHTDELRGSGYVTAKATDLGHQIVPLESFARLAKRKAQQFLAADAARNRWHERANLRWKHRGRDLGVWVAERKDHQSFDIISELANVSGPIMRTQAPPWRPSRPGEAELPYWLQRSSKSIERVRECPPAAQLATEREQAPPRADEKGLRENVPR